MISLEEIYPGMRISEIVKINNLGIRCWNKIFNCLARILDNEDDNYIVEDETTSQYEILAHEYPFILILI